MLKTLKPAVFFDRDGIIVKTVDNEAPITPESMELNPEIIEVINKCRKLGYLVIVVSNQPDLALEKIDEKTSEDLQKKFIDLCSKRNILPDKIYYCMHHLNSNNPKYAIDCDCRKPKPGMLVKAVKELGVDMSKSSMVGDRASDIKAGLLAGVEKTILYDPSSTQDSYLLQHNIQPTHKISYISDLVLYL